MADTTMNSVTIPNITPAVNDLLLAWDASAAANGEFPISDMVTLLNSYFASLSGAAFTGNVTTSGYFQAIAVDAGATERIGLSAARNSNVTTPTPGVISVDRAASASTSARLYPDDSGIWRTMTLGVTNATYAAGTVVGSQSSSLDAKDVIGDVLPIDDVLAAIAEGAAGVRKFMYKASLGESGEPEGPRPYNGERFEGVIVDFAPRYGMDRDDTHPAGKNLNEITVTGDLLRAVDYLVKQVAALQAELAQPKG